MALSADGLKLLSTYEAGACGGLFGIAVTLVVYATSASDAEKLTLRYFWAIIAIFGCIVIIGLLVYCVIYNAYAISALDQEKKKEIEEIKLKQKEIEENSKKIQKAIIDIGLTLIQNRVSYDNNLEKFAYGFKEFTNKYNNQLTPDAVFILQNMSSTIDKLVQHNNNLRNDIYQLLNIVARSEK